MARLTHDAIKIQAVLAPGEELVMRALASRAFCPGALPGAVTLMRTRRAVQILKERNAVDVKVVGDALFVTSKVQPGNSAIQMQAMMSLVVVGSLENDDLLVGGDSEDQ